MAEEPPLSPDEETQDSSQSKDAMDEDETQDSSQHTVSQSTPNNKENTNKSNSKKRKNDTETEDDAPPHKKRKTDTNTNNKNKKSEQTLIVTIGSDKAPIAVPILLKIPYFSDKIKDTNGQYTYNKNRDSKIKPANNEFAVNDFQNMVTFVGENELGHIESIEQLQSLIYCCDRFGVKLDIADCEKVYHECEDKEELYKAWKNSERKVLKKLYKKIQTENEQKEEETDTEMSETKRKKRRAKKSKKKDKGSDDDEMSDKSEKKTKKKKKSAREIERDRKRRRERTEKLLEIPAYMRLSDDENKKMDRKKSKSQHSKRLQQQQMALMTQEPMNISDNDTRDESDEESEKYIQSLDDIKSNEISKLTTKTIHRLCRKHDINVRLKETKSMKDEREKCKKRYIYPKIEDKKLVKKLKEQKRIRDRESKIKDLKDVDSVEDIGELTKDTIYRLCQEHRIKRGRKLKDLIKDLEFRWDNPLDEDDFIETLKDVTFEDIEELEREVLVRLCIAHKVPTTEKKPKKRRKKKKKRKGRNESDSDSDSESGNDSEDSVIDVDDDVLIQALQTIKQVMNEKKVAKTKKNIAKLTQTQHDIVDIACTDHYLTISGENTFKEDCLGLVALCNSINANKGKNYSVVDDPLDPYKVCITEGGGRTVKVMMCIARGGNVVNKTWLNHSIKGKKWVPPHNYEHNKWENSGQRSRESKIRKRKRKKKAKRKKSDETEEGYSGEESDGLCSDESDTVYGPLLKEYSIHVQDRPAKTGIKPSANILKHLAQNVGAKVVNKKWNSVRLSKKKDLLESDGEEREEKQSQRKRKRGKKKGRDSGSGSESGNDKEEAEESESGSAKKKKKAKKGKRQRVRAVRSRESNKNKNKNKKTSDGSDSDSGGSDGSEEELVPRKGRKKKEDLRERLVISHPAIYKDLSSRMRRDKAVTVIGQSWLFECIENFKVMPIEDYIVKPNRNTSESPQH